MPPGGQAAEARRALAAAGDVVAELRHALGPILTGAYLHGSAALGGFRWGRSDLDLLAVVARPLTGGELAAAARAVEALDLPAGGLECTLLTEREAAEPELPAPRFQLHLRLRPPDPPRAVDGRTRSGDRDLVLHFAVCRARGIALTGPPHGEAFGAVPAAAVLAAGIDEIEWARGHASPEYLVLTAARAWLLAETALVASKIEAGEWAARRYGSPEVLRAAVAAQLGTASRPLGGADALAFAAHAERLARAAETPSLLDAAAAWAAAEPRIRAVALVGSRACGNPRPDSDLDLVVLSSDAAGLLADDRWFGRFGQVELVSSRDFGAVRERRLRRPSGFEIEVGIAATSWAAVDPVDAGTADVVRGGLRPLYDPDGLLSALSKGLRR